MIIEEKGFYRLLENYSIRTSCSITRILEGTIIEITQVDKEHKKIIGNGSFSSWVDWNLPAEKIDARVSLTSFRTDKEMLSIKLEYLLREIVSRRKSINFNLVDRDVDEVTVKEAVESLQKVLASAPR